jgi:O-antigen/teichoic acid export membrane protein
MFMSGTLIINIAKVLLIPVYARYLSPSEYGVLGAANAISGFMSMLILLGLDAAVVRQYYDLRANPGELRSFLSSVGIFMAVLNLTALAILLTIGPRLFAWLLPGKKVPFWPYVALGLIIASLTSFLGVFMALLQAQKRTVFYVAAQICRFVALVGLTLLLLIRFHMGAQAPLWAELAATGLAVLALAGMFFRKQAADTPDLSTKFHVSNHGQAGPVFSASKLRAALTFGVPLVPHEVSNWALAVSDRLILTRYRPVEEVGVYVLGYSMAMSMNFLVGAFNFAYVPFFLDTAQNHPRAKQVFGAIARLYSVGMGAICLVAMLFAQEMLIWIAPPTYSKSARVLEVVLLAFFFMGLYLVGVLPFFHTKRTSKLPLLSGLAATVNIGLNLLLVPRYGAMAAAWTTLAAYILLFAVVILAAQRFYAIDYKWGRFVGPAVLVAILGLTLSSQSWGVKTLACGAYFAIAACLVKQELDSVSALRTTQ